MKRKKRLALVLAGGAARGAYEVGVVQHIVREVAKETGREIKFDILCGTSVGALNACGLAAFAHEGPRAVDRLEKIWAGLVLSELIAPDLRGLMGLGSRVLGRGGGPVDEQTIPARESGLLDARGLERLLARTIPFDFIEKNLEAGNVDALTVSTTHVASGKTVVFVQQRGGGLPEWSRDPTVVPRAATITVRHALASAAIPILFRAVRLGNEFHCDGGLRQNVPLSPARRLGADGLIIINPRHITDPSLAGDSRTEEDFPGLFFLLGKTLNALLLDRIDTDLARLDGINRILDAGMRAYGEGFVSVLNRELGYQEGHGLRPLRTVMVRSGVDIGKFAAEFVRARSSRLTGLMGRIVRHLSERTGARAENDLLSYLLFDGEFASALIEVGRADARARHLELCKFIENLREQD